MHKTSPFQFFEREIIGPALLPHGRIEDAVRFAEQLDYQHKPMYSNGVKYLNIRGTGIDGPSAAAI